MPTITNPETGETREIPAEEVRETTDGEGALPQDAACADDAVPSAASEGKSDDDGPGRSVQVFMDTESFNAVLVRRIKMLTGEIKTPPPAEDLEEPWEMSFDLTDATIMGILRTKGEELAVDLFTRNERKDRFDALRQAAKAWKRNPDGGLAMNAADLMGKDRTVSLYMLGFMEIRRFMKAAGKWEELIKGEPGIGVIFKATGQADDAELTVVRGKERPDLPCSTLLLGAQMMRPYPDEATPDGND